MSARRFGYLAGGARRRAAVLLAAGAAGVGAACNEDFVTGPRDTAVTLDIAGWADTLVLGDARTLRVRVRDARGREVVGVPTQLDVTGDAGAAVLDARLNAAGPSTARLAVTAGADSVAVAATHPGVTGVVVTLLDPRFPTTEVRRTATVVVAGVRASTAHDTTLTALGDTSVLVATALARQGTGVAADYLAVPGQGVTWTRRGSGAVRLVGSGDSVHVVAEAAGVDTLVASHARCLAGARCADTTLVRVAQGGAVTLASRALLVWSLGDSVAPQVVLADARGNAVGGARVAFVPLTAADSALVAVQAAPAAGTATFSAARGPALSRGGSASAAPILRLVTTAGAVGTETRAVSAAPLAAPVLATPILVARANGTARVAVRALAADGALLASDTLTVVVRQIARTVHVAPATADLTPGDSIPVAVTAVDARGYPIPDADFQPAAAGAVYRGGRLVVPATAAAGQRATLAFNVVGVAQPTTYPAAPLADPAPDSSRVRVRVPAPASAGDTSSADARDLTTTLLDAAGRPRAGVWVRFNVPAGNVVGVDSVLTDPAGVARTRWALPTRAGNYTATAVVLADGATGATRADSAGQIVLRRTVTVVAGAPAAVTTRAGDGQGALAGASLAGLPRVRVVDAYGNPVAGVAVTFAVASGGGTVAGAATQTIPTDTAGEATAGTWTLGAAAGPQTLTATALGLPPATITATATAPPNPPLVLVPATATMQAGATQQFTLAAAANGPVLWSVNGVDGGDATSGVVDASGHYTAPAAVPSPATVQVCARLQADASVHGCAAVTVTAPPSLPLVLAPATVEKLPNTTHQFGVTSGGAGPYVWSVNGVDGGTAAAGLVSATGLYTAPAAVPTPDTVQVCARRQVDPASQGCASVTIAAQPAAGGDMLVVNDLNVWTPTANNAFFTNILTYSAGGARGAQLGVRFFAGRTVPAYAFYGVPSTAGALWSGFVNVATNAGFTISEQSSGPLTSIPSTVKVLVVSLVDSGWTNAELNVLKQFASEGGRILLVGENSNALTPAQIGYQNALAARLGSALVNQGECGSGPYPTVGSHQLVQGVTTVSYACASSMVPGPQDFPLVRTSDGKVWAAVTKIDLAPLP